MGKVFVERVLSACPRGGLLMCKKSRGLPLMLQQVYNSLLKFPI